MDELPFRELPPEEGLWDVGMLKSPFMPSLGNRVEGAFQKIGLGTQDVVCDLGCGDGIVLFKAIEMGAKLAIGVELNSELLEGLQSEIQRKGFGGKILVKLEDFLETDLSEVSVLYLYLIPEALAVLKEKLRKGLEGGIRVIVSAVFFIKDFGFRSQYDYKTDCYFYYNN